MTKLVHVALLSVLFTALAVLIVEAIPGDQGGYSVAIGFVCGMLGPAIALWPDA